jgi:hypothetical protein
LGVDRFHHSKQDDRDKRRRSEVQLGKEEGDGNRARYCASVILCMIDLLGTRYQVARTIGITNNALAGWSKWVDTLGDAGSKPGLETADNVIRMAQIQLRFAVRIEEELALLLGLLGDRYGMLVHDLGRHLTFDPNERLVRLEQCLWDLKAMGYCGDPNDPPKTAAEASKRRRLWQREMVNALANQRGVDPALAHTALEAEIRDTHRSAIDRFYDGAIEQDE